MILHIMKSRFGFMWVSTFLETDENLSVRYLTFIKENISLRSSFLTGTKVAFLTFSISPLKRDKEREKKK